MTELYKGVHRATAAVAMVLAGSALTGCKADKIESCPAHYPFLETNVAPKNGELTSPVTNTGDSFEALRSGIAKLVRKEGGMEKVKTTAVSPEDAAAMRVVFGRPSYGEYDTTFDNFEGVGNVFCTSDEKVYFSPDAASAIASLEVGGIEVALPAAAGK